MKVLNKFSKQKVWDIVDAAYIITIISLLFYGIGWLIVLALKWITNPSTWVG